MPRKRVHIDNAAKMRAYRKALREQGKRTDTRQRFARLEEWKIANPAHRKAVKPRKFVGLDTEGITRGTEHICTLLSDSMGNYIEDYDKGISTCEAFEFLLRSGKGNKILVGYNFVPLS